MVMPRDWLPPFPPGDPRNAVHKAAWDKFAALYPDSSYAARSRYADDVLSMTPLPKSGGR